MTNEQREAVEFLEFYKQHCLKIEIENMDNYETVHDGDFVSKNLDTVLSLLKENSAEIQQKNTELAEKSAELDKKDKQIDLMAIRILVKIIGDYPCGYKQDCIKSDKEYKDIHCKDCIKQYFETKAKKGE